MNKQAFSGQVAVVTGSAHGIGLAIAHKFAAEGARVVMADLDEKPIERAASEVRAKNAGAEVMTYAGDLSREATVSGLLERAGSAFGPATILVNNAGGGVIKPFLEHTSETLRATIDRNLWTVIWCCRAFLPGMLEAGYGRIINMGADSVRNGLLQHAAYNGAKGGVHGLTTGLAREFATTGVTVNTVAPCAVRTAALDRVRETDPSFARHVVDAIPMGRPGEVDEIAAAVLFLAGKDASFITGQVLSVNGGSTML
ncbi:SDR family oxidoreductase [Thauera linaloolentis]|uniref:Short-chain dehydrogenase/reductase SDR n=1 Tax=Thauera linaloolentis (strain DSM 12138 / JCM 21573 / CCUG 41526 / CIP 105981 / IAM 15112 / NBRC 102519 / 47Lol) TaxID=1123367 RepID=N6Z6K2_THAL4|nr:SDR family oxidoreductase [Thauera linaloolentis]ENO87804.1 short-chain dehydrogenase/reductase SDR [Thauera linaloolentis 47Lol = DSM 12138]MCM8565273.1 SDR family oxidoreductase [Thauera linaloolentis]